MEKITAKTARPPKGYTDSQWQLDFHKLKDTVIPSSAKKLAVPSEYCAHGEEYHGETQYQCYCHMINDILANVRHGGTDYCFYIYQVAELLRFEHDRLKVKWLEDDECFSIRL